MFHLMFHLNIMFQRGANVNLVDSDGRTALMLTVIAAPIQAEHGAQHRHIINTLVKCWWPYRMGET